MRLPGYWGKKNWISDKCFLKKLEIANSTKKILKFERFNCWQIHWNEQPETLKKLQILSKNANIRDIKMLKTNPL